VAYVSTVKTSSGAAWQHDPARRRCRSPPCGAAHLWDALFCAYEVLGFDQAAGGDEVFRQLGCARIIEPTSKADSLRVLEETGVAVAAYPTLTSALVRQTRFPASTLVGLRRSRRARSGVSGAL
jgi:hypothetical protein